MKKQFFRIILLIPALVSMLFLSCDDSNRYPEILDIGWTLENIDSSFWEDSDSYRSAFLNIWIAFEESELVAESIESVAIVSPTGVYWQITAPEALTYYYDTESLVFGGWFRFYSTSPASNGSVLPIGNYEFDVTYTNSKTVTKLFTIPAPGSTTSGSTSYVYTEDYTGTIGGDYKALPKRANITNCVLTSANTEVTIEFNVDDSNIYNCSIWFYDESGNYVGRSGWLRDFSTGSLASVINNGTELNVDGSNNSIVLSLADISYQEGKTSADLNSVHIILTDGLQYASSTDIDGYDTRSISAKSFIY